MKRFALAPLPWLILFVLAGGAPLFAAGFAGTATASLASTQEVPAVFSFAGGTLTATLNEAGTSISWTLDYSGLVADVTQAHIHFGQTGVNGGIMVFFCSNLGNGPAGTQACPARSGQVTGTFEADDVVGSASAQGVNPGQFRGLLFAIIRGVAYANVHSTKFPSGEIRGQLKFTPTP